MQHESIRYTVAVIIHDANGNFLILRRNPVRYKGWGFVKGGIEAGETPLQAMVREVQEEIGIMIHEADFQSLNYKSAYYDNQKKRIVTVEWFTLALPPSTRLVLEREEWVEYRWACYEEALYEVAWQTQQKALQQAGFFLKLGKSASV